MNPRIRAFATLTAASLMVLATAFVSGAVLISQHLLLEQTKAQKVIDERANSWKTIDSLFTTLQQTWNVQEQSLDSWWTSGRSQAFPSGTQLISLSSRVNLNSMTPFLLQDSELSTTLLGKSAEDFTTYRTNAGPFVRVDDCKDYFQPQALTNLFCVHSFFNVNTADEIMIEKIIAARTGNEALASTVRSHLREYRTNRQVLAASDWDALIGADKESVGELVSTDPELDVNTVSPVLLQAVLRDPDFKLDQADTKLQAILTGRASKPWDDDTLRQVLNVDKNSLLLQYLGTKCKFLQLTVPEGTGTLTLVATIDYSTDSPPKITLRVLQMWRSSI
jgi:hypothetical protein